MAFSYYLMLASGRSMPLLPPETSPSPSAAASPSQLMLGLALNENHHSYHLTLVPGIGIAVTIGAVIMLVVLIILIRRKSRELDDSDNFDKISSKHIPHFRPMQKLHDGMLLCCILFTSYVHSSDSVYLFFEGFLG